MGVELEARYRLRASDFDRCQRILPSALLDLFSDCATLHADEMGIGLKAVRSKGLMWAVTRIRYEVLAQPKVHDEVLVRTWPHTLTRFSFLRDYQVKSLDGEMLVKATSEWVLMDVENRSFSSVRDFYEGTTEFCEERIFEHKPRKLADFEPTDAGNGTTIVPCWTDVDVNGHVNNAKYANYALEEVRLGPDESVAEFQIDFRREVMCGQPLSVESLRDGADIHVRGLDSEGAIMFACLFRLA